MRGNWKQQSTLLTGTLDQLVKWIYNSLDVCVCVNACGHRCWVCPSVYVHVVECGPMYMCLWLSVVLCVYMQGAECAYVHDWVCPCVYVHVVKGASA